MRNLKILLLLFLLSANAVNLWSDERPNVLFIAIDDLNDWAGPFGGNPQCKTPNMDRFAEEGATVFMNNHCAGPVCGPSRSALLSGFAPYNTGLYSNSDNMLDSEIVQTHATLPEYFNKHGYATASSGKIFHAHRSANGFDRGQWAFENWIQTGGGWGVDQDTLYSRRKGILNGVVQENPKYADPHGSEFAWASTTRPTEETGDYMTAQWAAGQLQKKWDRPFFLAVGIFRPHLPWYAPQEFYDMYDLDTIELPEVKDDDLDDIVDANGKPAFKPSSDYLWCRQDDSIFKAAVRAYMASTSYADYCLGVILDALKDSPHYDNTIVFIWGDHGWHLGEKLRFRKATIFSEATRAPLMVRLPGMNKVQRVYSPTNLLDMYPTLVELCGLPEKELDGTSFANLLKDPSSKGNKVTLTTRGVGSVSVRDEHWRYARYRDGAEELYNLKEDPMEWTNLVNSNRSAAKRAKKKLAKHFPKSFAEPIESKNYPRVAGPDLTLKAKRDLAALK